MQLKFARRKILSGLAALAGGVTLVQTSKMAHASTKPDMYSKHWPLRADVDLRKQSLDLVEYGKKIYTWKISSGKKGYYTPQGVYSPKWMRKMHYSNTYDNAPMPHAVFFYKGYAIHGTEWTAKLGSEASKGCIRLHEDAAKEFFKLVEEHGMKKTRINITY